MARRTRDWGALDPTYRARLERGGITRGAYESGVRVQGARGHRVAEHRARAENVARAGKEFNYISGGQVVTATSRLSRERKLAARYMSAVGNFARNRPGSAAKLRSFRGRKIEGRALETDPAVLRALVRSGDLRKPFYEPQRAAA